MAGKRKDPQGPVGPNIGAGSKGGKVSGDLKLFHYNIQDRHQICGGMISKRGGGANRFCVATNCGFAHDKKAFDRLEDGAYYIVDTGGGRGAGSSQQPRALLEPSLPKAATEYSVDNYEVLAAKNSMQGWLSLFRYLIEAEERGDIRAPNPALTEFAARARATAFTTPLRDITKRARDDDEESSASSRLLGDRPSDFTTLQDAIMGVQGELGVRPLQAEYCTVHGGLKSLSEELVALEGTVSDRFDAFNIGAVRLEVSLATARSTEVKTWMEQTQSIGGGEEGRRIRAEMDALRGRCDFLEGAFTQMTNFIIDLKDKLDTGGGGTAPRDIPLESFASQSDLLTHMRTVGVCLEGFRQEMKGAPLEFGGHSFQGLDSCIAWAQTNMPESTYQCIPSMFYGLCLIRESVLYKQDMRDDDIQAHRVQRSPMQSAAVESVNTAIPSILEGPKTSVLKDPKHDFGAMKTFAEWKPTNGQGGASARLKEGLEGAWQQIRGAIDLFLGGSPAAKGVMQEMLAEYKVHTSAIFITELTLYYDEILSKTGGDPPHSKEVKESCWALVTKLLRTILKEVHKVRRFAAEAVSIGSDSMSTNGMFLYAALEELRVLREFATCDWHNHPKFNQNIVRHLFETCLPRAVFENRKEGAGLHTLKINALTTVTERHQVLLNGVATGMGELRTKVGLPPGKRTKFAKGTSGDAGGTLEIE
jgi:hypothetical protein